MGEAEGNRDTVKQRSREDIVNIFQEYAAGKSTVPSQKETYEETPLIPQQVNKAFSEPDEQGRYDNRLGYRNLAWCAGMKPHNEVYGVDGDAEIIEYEVRGVQHDLDRVPNSMEIKDGVHGALDAIVYKPSGKYDSLTELRWGLGMPPYKEFSVPSDVEDAVVDRVFVESESLKAVLEDEREYEAVRVAEHYLPWVNDQHHDVDQVWQTIEKSQTTSGSNARVTKDELVSLYTLGRQIDATLQEIEEDYTVAGRHRLPQLHNTKDNMGDFEEGISDWFEAIVRSLPGDYTGEHIRDTEKYSALGAHSQIPVDGSTVSKISTGEPVATGDGSREQRAEYAEYTSCLDYFEGDDAAERKYHYWLNRIGPENMPEQIDVVVQHIHDELDGIEQS